ncbi:MAG: phytanoyl-CoA dioxygenase family protein [Methylococcaceae bacterium]|nr:phytanoyl-CoA dioxygenase family protein [Methylococcaceae bacterium]
MAELYKDGVTFFPQFLSRNEIEEIKLELEKYNCFDPWHREIGEFTYTQNPVGTHVGQIRLAATIEILHKLALDSRIIDVVTAYFGCKPYLDSIQAWWSFSGNDQPQEAENFHRDNDAIRFLKFFLYVTEVDDLNGPHIFVLGSHREAKLLERRRLNDEEVADTFGNHRIRSFTGKSGDAFIEDTYGIHKGQLPVIGKRLLVQFRYTTTESVFRSPLIVSTSRYYQPSRITSLLYE